MTAILRCNDIPQMYKDKLPYSDTGERHSDIAPYCCEPCHDYHENDMYTITVDGENYYVCCAVRRWFIPPTPKEEADTRERLASIFGEG